MPVERDLTFPPLDQLHEQVTEEEIAALSK
jgi:hypothetical protein